MVAIKCSTDHLESTREAAFLAYCQHENIVKIVDSHCSGSFTAIAMEKMLCSLAVHLTTQSKQHLPADKAPQILRQIALGLAHMHSKKV